MKFFIYQMYDAELEAFTITNVLDATPEQMQYSCKAASVKKPETLVGKDHCLLFLAGEVDSISGNIVVYDKKEVVFDYTQACQGAIEKQKALAKEVTENVQAS